MHSSIGWLTTSSWSSIRSQLHNITFCSHTSFFRSSPSPSQARRPMKMITGIEASKNSPRRTPHFAIPSDKDLERRNSGSGLMTLQEHSTGFPVVLLWGPSLCHWNSCFFLPFPFAKPNFLTLKYCYYRSATQWICIRFDIFRARLHRLSAITGPLQMPLKCFRNGYYWRDVHSCLMELSIRTDCICIEIWNKYPISGDVPNFF